VRSSQSSQSLFFLTLILACIDTPRTVVRQPASCLNGILELEEVEGVEVVYEDTDVGRVVKVNVSRCFVLLQIGDFLMGEICR
jgi:hypothetical protein